MVATRLILVVALFLALDLGTCSVESGNSRHTNRKNKLDRSIDVHNHPKKWQAADIAKKLRRQQHQHRFKHFADDDDDASTRSDENTTPGATTTATTSSPSSLTTQSDLTTTDDKDASLVTTLAPSAPTTVSDDTLVDSVTVAAPDKVVIASHDDGISVSSPDASLPTSVQPPLKLPVSGNTAAVPTSLGDDANVGDDGGIVSRVNHSITMLVNTPAVTQSSGGADSSAGINANSSISDSGTNSTDVSGSCSHDDCQLLSLCDELKSKSNADDKEGKSCTKVRIRCSDPAACPSPDSMPNVVINHNFAVAEASSSGQDLDPSKKAPAALAASSAAPSAAPTVPTSYAGDFVPGTAQIGVGYDLSKGKFKLPVFEWKTISPTHITRPGLLGAMVPDAIALSISHSGKRSYGPNVFSSQAQYTRSIAKRMGISSPEGALTQSEDAELMRSINLYSDLTVKETEFALYQLSIYPDTHNYQLSQQFINAIGELPDCELADCAITEDPDIGKEEKGCRPSATQGMYMPHVSTNSETLPAPNCATWAVTPDATKDQPECASRFFRDSAPALRTDVSKTFKICPDLSKDPGSPGNGTRDCMVFGNDEGAMCNMHDLRRIARFITEWGTHVVMGGEFGGAFRQLVQTKKDSPWKQAVTGQEKVFNFPIPNLPGMEANAALRGMQYSNPSFPHSFPFNSSGTLATVELRKTAEERSGLEQMGIQEITYQFEGGSRIPVSTEKLFVEDVKTWIDSLSDAPVILPHTMDMQQISELLSHISLAKIMDNSQRLRKQTMLENYLRYWNVKSSQLGNLLDQAAVMDTQSAFQMARMHGAVHDTVENVVAMEGHVHEMLVSDGKQLDTSSEMNRMIARGVIDWQQSSQRFVSTCRNSCDLNFVIRMRKQMLRGHYTLPSSWRYFPMPPDPSSNNALRQSRDTLVVDRQDCSSSCAEDVALARQSHEPAGYVGAHRETVHEFFALLKAGCLICRGLIKTLLQSAALGNGRGATNAHSYCENSLWSAWSDPYFTSQVFDVTQPFAFSKANTQKEGPRDYSYANRFCEGLSEELLEPIRAWLRRNGLVQLHENPTLFETLQLMMMSSDLGADALSEKMCADYAGCSQNGPSPIDRKISANVAQSNSLENSIKTQTMNIEAYDKFLAQDGLSAGAKKTITAEKKALETAVGKETKTMTQLTKDLTLLYKESNTTASSDKKHDNTCLFECYKTTAWGKQFAKDRTSTGLMDPIPSSQLAALHAGEPCGYPVTIPKSVKVGAKCTKCTALSCLVEARLKCYGYSCTSPYVSTSGVAFYVPKTIVI